MGSGTVPTPSPSSTPSPTPTSNPNPTPPPSITPTPTSGGGSGPTTTITSPTNGATVSNGANVTVTATDSDGVEIVYLVVDGVVKGSDSTVPYSISLNANDGSHTIFVRAWDKLGNAGDSATITVNVTGGTTPNPTPTPEAILSFSPSSLSFTGQLGSSAPAAKTATLSNTGNASASVTLTTSHNWCHVTPALLPPLASGGTSQPITVSVDTPSNQGTFFCTVSASRFANDPTPTLLTVSYTVGQAGDTIAPIAVLTFPINGTIVAARSTTPIQANVSDNGVVTKVEFYINGALNKNCIDTTTPYSCNWKVTGAKNKIYRIEARAYDASGNIGRSDISTVTAK